MIWAQVLIVAYALTLVGIRRKIFAMALALPAMLPLHEGVSLAMALRGLWGDPSITTLQLLVLAMAGKSPPAFCQGYRAPLCIALISLGLYVSALGPWNPDIYRLGYQPAVLVSTLGAVALICWWRGESIWIWLLSADLLAWQASWLESTNLWDSLLDPLLMFAMLALAWRNGYRAHRNRKILQCRS